MRFTEQFRDFVCEGDSIACMVACYEITAQIVRDDCPDEPDQRQDGFWPSLCKDAPGFIGSQSVKSTESGGIAGFDAGKRIKAPSGIF